MNGPNYLAEFGVENVDGEAYISGFGETIKVKPGERVILTHTSAVTLGDIRPGIQASCEEESA